MTDRRSLGQIELAERAMSETRAKLNAMTAGFDRAKDCCHSCRYGRPFSILVSKIERQAMWLRVQYRKRGDVAAVARLDHEHGRRALDALEASGGNDGTR